MREAKLSGVSSTSSIFLLVSSANHDTGIKAICPFLFLISFVLPFISFALSIFVGDLEVVMPSTRL